MMNQNSPNVSPLSEQSQETTYTSMDLCGDDHMEPRDQGILVAESAVEDTENGNNRPLRRRIQLVNKINDYLVHVSRITSEGKLYDDACWEAFYSCDQKGRYPFGCGGYPGVHNDVLAYLRQRRYSWGTQLHDAMLGHQFMTQHIREVKSMEGQRFTASFVEEYKESILRKTRRLPLRTQRYLGTWIGVYVENLSSKFNLQA